MALMTDLLNDQYFHNFGFFACPGWLVVILQTFWRTNPIALLFWLDTLSSFWFYSKCLPWSLIAILHGLVIAKLILHHSFVSSVFLSQYSSLLLISLGTILLFLALSLSPVKGASALTEPSVTLHLSSEITSWSYVCIYYFLLYYQYWVSICRRYLHV